MCRLGFQVWASVWHAVLGLGRDLAAVAQAAQGLLATERHKGAMSCRVGTHAGPAVYKLKELGMTVISMVLRVG